MMMMMMMNEHQYYDKEDVNAILPVIPSTKRTTLSIVIL